MKKFNIALLALTASALAYGSAMAGPTAYPSGTAAETARDASTKPIAGVVAAKVRTNTSINASNTSMQRVNDGKVSALTNEFVKKASNGNAYEIQLSKLALDKSDNRDIRDFAQQMIDDHTKVAANLKAVLPSDIDSMQASNELTQPQLNTIARLKDLDDKAKFDAAFITEQRKAHSDAVGLYEKYARKGDEKDLRDFANNTLPSLKAHEQHVASLKVEPSTASRDSNNRSSSY